MTQENRLYAALHATVARSKIDIWNRRCRPRILVVTDGQLNYHSNHHFGLTRFVEAITATTVVPLPIVTLAHRGNHTATVLIGNVSYSVAPNFNFDSATPSVALANYDQLWLFGFDGGPGAGLTQPEVAKIATFMNSGGGLFATGDHGTLGQGMCGDLPRVRHARIWDNSPMGLEPDVNIAVRRLDTVVDPGANGQYEFLSDQADVIPQRIFPNYRTTDTDNPALSGSSWSSKVHPILMLPGAPAVRTNSSNPQIDFSKDIDVLPDHQHESECLAVTSLSVLTSAYTLHGLNFREFQPLATSSSTTHGAEIVAFSVSGGRSVSNGGWKPPVTPRLFGAISAYNGRIAAPYVTGQPTPGNFIADATWHHYVNGNIDGTNFGNTGLGSGTGSSFIPSPALQKIQTLYRNMISWLQPANRIWCLFWPDLIALRVHPSLAEELIEPKRFTQYSEIVALGRTAIALIASSRGRGLLSHHVLDLLATEPRTVPVFALLSSNANADALDRAEIEATVIGALLLEVADIVPLPLDERLAQSLFESGLERHLPALRERLVRAIQLAAQGYGTRLKREVNAVKALAKIVDK